MLLAFLFVPLLGAAIMPILRKIYPKGATFVTVLVSLYLVVATGWIAYQNFLTGHSLVLGQWLLNQNLALNIDGLSLVVLAAIGLVTLVTAIYSAGYHLHPDRRPGYNALLLLIVTGMNGLVMATDLFSLYVFLEIVSIAAYILIAYQTDEHGLEASFKYMMLSAVATVFLLLGTALLFTITGSVSFADLAIAVKSGGLIVQLGFAMIVFAFAVKAGMIPFHAWLPDAYTAAPAPVSILLAGIVTKVGGVYTLMQSYFSSFRLLQFFFRDIIILRGCFRDIGGFFSTWAERFQTNVSFFKY